MPAWESGYEQGSAFRVRGSCHLEVVPKRAISMELLMRPLTLCLLVTCLAFPSGRAVGQEKKEPPKTAILFNNARLFDGKSDRLLDGMNLLVVGNKIDQLSKDPIKAPAGATVIDAAGRVLMPGMIDAHVHLMLPLTIDELQKADDPYITLRAAAEAKRMLDRGFTTVRDTAGATFGLKRAIDEGLIDGPRIFPSGAAISQTGGHGDFRKRPDRPRRWDGRLDRFEQLGLMTLADGRDEVLAATREQLRLGATQIKLMAGGGVASEFDPLDVSQYLEDELKAAVQAAADWGTYVTVHAYNPRAINRAITAGVKCIEHGQLMDEATLKRLAANGLFLSPQVMIYQQRFAGLDEAREAKRREVLKGMAEMFKLAKKHEVKVCFGTDVVFSRELFDRQSKELTARLEWFKPVEVLRQATSTNGELLALSGKRNPYGKLGVIEKDALADLLLVKGNPLEKLSLLEDPDNLVVIMKDGRIYKRTIP
jgi:imidazolonepropionase-like amidohydrolase